MMTTQPGFLLMFPIGDLQVSAALWMDYEEGFIDPHKMLG